MSDQASAAARAVILSWVDEAQSEGKTDAYRSKRALPRHTWDRPLEMLIEDKVEYVYARDINSKGVGLVCKTRLQPQGVVHIRSNDAEPWVRCRVVHVTQTVGAYKVGVELRFELDG